MDFYVFDPDYKPLGILSNPVSVIYTEKYSEIGDFQIVLPIDEINAGLVKSDNVVLFDREHGIAGIIGIINSTGQSKDGTPQLTVKGKLIEEYLNSRICWGLFEQTGTPEEVILAMLNTQVISPADEQRKIPDLIIGQSSLEDQESLSYQDTGGKVGDNIASICQSSSLGFRMTYDAVQKNMTFQLYKGQDRTVSQKVVPQALFSTEFENILSSSYSVNSQDMKNVALVAGQDSSQNRKTVTVGEASGKARKELYVDARDIQSENSDGMTISESEYLALLTQRGNEKLSESRAAESFDCTVNTVGNIEYNKDYFLGDIATISDSLLAVELNARIAEVEHSYSSEGEELYITFGISPMTLTKKLKLRGL